MTPSKKSRMTSREIRQLSRVNDDEVVSATPSTAGGHSTTTFRMNNSSFIVQSLDLTRLQPTTSWKHTQIPKCGVKKQDPSSQRQTF
jgi:hypothetical protein